MVIALWTLLASAGCEPVTAETLTGGEPPFVLVLGERHGHRKELRRAAEVVERLAARGPVTVALEAVHGDHQDAADALAVHGRRRRFKRESEWSSTWGFRLGAYWPVLRQAGVDVAVVGAGLDLGPAPEDRTVAIPDGYAEQLAEAMAGHEMPPEMAARFTRSMAWRDLRIAEQAVNSWDGRGALVIVTGRGHVEGGRGVTWQLPELTEAPVRAALLDAEDATCEAGTPALTD